MQLSDEDIRRLEEMSNDTNARMRESDFTRRLLPHLVPGEDRQPRDVSIYVAAAGHPNRMIDVVSDSNEEEVLFTVPPLISPTPMVIRGRDTSPETDVSELTAIFTARMDNVPSGMLIDSYVNRLVELNYSPTEAISTTYSLMWAQIYDRYNIPLERLFGEDAPRVAQALGKIAPIEDKSQPATAGAGLEDLDDDDFEPF